MKIRNIKNQFIFNFLISILLIVTLIPLNLSNPEDNFIQVANEYHDVISDYSLYSTFRSHSRSVDFNDQYFSSLFSFDSNQQKTYALLNLLNEQFVFLKLLPHRLINLPPPCFTIA